MEFLVGLNFHGINCASYQNRPLPIQPPKDYINDSFKIFSQAGIQCIRFPLYWESYERDPLEFIHELDNISSTADKYDILCVYDNHQWGCSSYFGKGIGFPNSLLVQCFKEDTKSSRSSNSRDPKDLKKFWNDWWDRKLSVEGKDGWDAQSEFLERVINTVKNKNSTLGFEILNEPQIFRLRDYERVGKYHDYIITKLSAITEKTLFFCYTYPSPRISFSSPFYQLKTKPSVKVKNKIIFDVHPYPPWFLTMGYYKAISQLMGKIPVYVGEFNAGTEYGVTINTQQFNKYVKTLEAFKVSGCAFWEWSYTIDNNHPAFNLTNVIDNKIYPNTNFKNLLTR